jgi:LCP family protein required for cell wall assembly
MSKEDANSTFDIDSDPKFNENFYKNIDLAIGISDADKPSVSENDREAGIELDMLVEDSKQTEYRDSEAEIDIAGQTKEIDLDQIASNIEQVNSSREAGDAATEGIPQQAEHAEDIVEEDIEEELLDINASLARKICEEMECIGAENAKERKKSKIFKIQRGILLSLLCVAGFTVFFGFTDPGNHMLMSMGLNLGGTIWSTYTGSFQDNEDVIEDVDHIDAEDVKSDSKEIDPTTIVWPDHPGEGRKEEGVYNILLLGEEAIGMGSSRGRTDVIVIATMNTRTRELKLTSLMRDTLVQIPGYKDNKLNTAYEKGGLDLLYETIALNFDLRLDGCVMVNFENFEKIIDKLGGLEITLTAGEAKYLNSTNYISKPEYRNVVEGKQLLNGNQVLGYSRVRKRATITGNNNDYGRTDRHRIVLNAIFEKYKTTSKVELAALMFEVMQMITTDIDSKCFELLLNSFIEMRTTSLSQLRIPADGAFEDNVKVRGMDVLIPDLQKNIEILHTFIFGNTDGNTNGSTDGNANNITITQKASAANGEGTSRSAASMDGNTERLTKINE